MPTNYPCDFFAKPEMKFRKSLTRVGLCVFSVLLTLVCSEVALRIYRAADRHSKAQDRPVPLHIVTDEPYLYGLNPLHPDISSQGTRDDAVVLPKPPRTVRMLVLGDSIAFGATLPKSDIPQPHGAATQGRAWSGGCNQLRGDGIFTVQRTAILPDNVARLLTLISLWLRSA